MMHQLGLRLSLVLFYMINGFAIETVNKNTSFYEPK